MTSSNLVGQEGAEGGVGRASRGLGRAVGRRTLARRRRLLGRPKVGQQLREPLAHGRLALGVVVRDVHEAAPREEAAARRAAEASNY